MFRMCMGKTQYTKLTKGTPCINKRNVVWSEDLTSVTYVPSRRSMSNIEKATVWYSDIQVEQFARDEVERRKLIGLESRQILCSEVIYTEC